MTHLNGDFLVVKDHPRIIFRGKLDTLESELILCQLTDKGLEAPGGGDSGAGAADHPL